MKICENVNHINQLISKPIGNQRLHITTVTSTTINILEISKMYLITVVDKVFVLYIFQVSILHQSIFTLENILLPFFYIS